MLSCPWFASWQSLDMRMQGGNSLAVRASVLRQAGGTVLLTRESCCCWLLSTCSIRCGGVWPDAAAAQRQPPRSNPGVQKRAVQQNCADMPPEQGVCRKSKPPAAPP
jgi:hypothetical protein